MTPVSQLIWRNRTRLDDARPALLVAPPEDDLGVRLQRDGLEPDLLCLSYAAHRRARDAGLSSAFGLEPPPDMKWPQIVLVQPREKALLELLLDLCRAVLEPGGTLLLAGENRAGIKSAGKRLGSHFSDWDKIDSARHCTLFRAEGPGSEAPYLLDVHITRWPMDLAGAELTVHSLPGVFAHGRLDAGTRLLLETLCAAPNGEAVSGRVLDFACGSGVIGAVLASRFPVTDLTLLDDFAPALESARRTLEANGLTGRLVASDGLAELLEESQDGRFDWMVSNPPFHRGVAQELDTAQCFIRNSRRVLAPGGCLCLVANVHLPYGRWLSELYGDVQVIAANREYNVWLAGKGKRKK